MQQDDPIGELVFLCRAAAEAGLDWRGRLLGEWLPRIVSKRSGTDLAGALTEWQGETPEPGTDLSRALESAVLEALAREGYF
jgi:hypothetical protein